ncbi:MAG: ABC transporter permease [Endomicrobiales bacterium]|nr:ABC transporter permease [Endomicrobiales bacterium]
MIRRSEKVASKLGEAVLDTATSLGRTTNIVLQTLYWISRGAIDWKNTVAQMVEVGWRSSPVIALTSLFTGMVLALQTGTSARNIFNEPVYIGTVVGFSLMKELGPVLTSVVISGRVGAAIAAELGTMKVTEQLDALFTLGTNPVKYLAVPRFLACVIMVPLLTIMANIVGVVGGLLITMYQFGIPSSVYWDDIFNFMEVGDLCHGLVKAVFFGAIIVVTSIYRGFNCEGGAEGVGKATTSAVMISMVLILISDYFLTAILVALGIG